MNPTGRQLIDLHTHILPGVDDGAADLDESLAMARLAEADGVAHLVATPHVPFCGRGCDALQERLNNLRDLLKSHQLDVRVSLGAEINLEPAMLHWLAHRAACPIESTRYVLVELPFFGYPPFTEDTVFQLQVQGYRPILVHPERNAELASAPSRLEPLVERGVLVQVTTTSLLGGFGLQARNAAVEFLRRGWVHVLASDAHSARNRPPVLSEGVRAAEKIVGEGAWNLVTTNPAAILSDQEIEPLRPAKKTRRWLK